MSRRPGPWRPPPTDASPPTGWDARKAAWLEAIAEDERAISARAGEQVLKLAGLVWETARHAGEDEADLDDEQRSVRSDLALRLRISEDYAESRLDQAFDLVSRLPLTLQALREGRIDLYKAGIIRDQTQHLTVEQCHRLEAGIVLRAGDQTPANLRRRVRKAVERIDSEALKKRAAAAAKERGVWLRESGDGMWTLEAYLPAQEAVGMFGVIDTLAHANKKTLEPGDDRGIGNLRADAMADLILRPDGEQRVNVDTRVVVGAGTLLGLDDNDGYLPGHGPIPAALCRELAADNTWRRILTDPCTGHLLDLGASRYAPSDRLAEFVKTRDQHCRFPGCRGRIDHSEIDHTIEFDIGGHTVRINVSLLCKRHHKVKHLPGWDLIQDPDGSGTLTFLSPTGQMFRTRPPDLLTGDDHPPEDLAPVSASGYVDDPPF